MPGMALENVVRETLFMGWAVIAHMVGTCFCR